jgi:hypothetical protein
MRRGRGPITDRVEQRFSFAVNRSEPRALGVCSPSLLRRLYLRDEAGRKPGVSSVSRLFGVLAAGFLVSLLAARPLLAQSLAENNSAESGEELAVQTAAEDPGAVGSSGAAASSSVALDQPPPSSARTNLLILGAATTVGFYGMSFGTSYLWPSSPVAEDLRIPVIGPYAAVFGAGCGATERGCGTFTAVLRTTLAGVSALGQTGGVLLLVEAVFLDTSSEGGGTPVRGATSANEPATGALAPRVTAAAPIVSDDVLGFAFAGTF